MDEQELAEQYEDILSELRDHAAQMADERDEALATLARIRDAINELLDFADDE